MQTSKTVSCPNCSSVELEKVFTETKYDNDLDEFSRNNNLSSKYPEIDFDELSQSSFSICKNCLLVFSTRRRKEENMYSMEFFADVQKRWYAQYPLPERYINQHKKFSNNFIEILNKNKFNLSPKPKILWLRSECGILPMELLKDVRKEDIFIMEYFESNIRFLKEHGFINVQVLPPGDFVNLFEVNKFTEIFLNHQLTHSFDPLKLTKSILQMLDDNGKIIFYNEIDHMESNKLSSHYPRGINNFHNQLFTKNSFLNLWKTNNAKVEFFEPLEPLSNASVNSGMFGIISKNINSPQKVTYDNAFKYDEELSSFRDWMKRHKKFKRKLRIKNFFLKFFQYSKLKSILKTILIILGLKSKNNSIS